MSVPGRHQRYKIAALSAPVLANISILSLFVFWPSDSAPNLLSSYIFAPLASIMVFANISACFSEDFRGSKALIFLVTNLGLLILIFAIIHLSFGRVEEGALQCRSVLDCLYFSTVTFTTLGYGDFQPLPQLRLLAAWEAFVGYIFLGFVIAIVADRLRPSDSRIGSKEQADDPGTTKKEAKPHPE